MPSKAVKVVSDTHVHFEEREVDVCGANTERSSGGLRSKPVQQTRPRSGPGGGEHQLVGALSPPTGSGESRMGRRPTSQTTTWHYSAEERSTVVPRGA